MAVDVFAIGGYEEVGMNMTAVKIDEKVFILDMGIALDKMILLQESGLPINKKNLLQSGAIPDDSILDEFKGKVEAIILSHAHLDHIGAVGYLAARYNAPVIGTPFTIELLKSNIKDDKLNFNNFVVMNAGEELEFGDVTLEFIHSTHSVPQTVFPVLHTKYGAVFYGIDYKLDNKQKLSPPTDYKRIRKIGNKGFHALIVEAIRSGEKGKTPSESVALEMLKDTLRDNMASKNAIVIACFSSHIERLNTIVEASKGMRRKVVFLGRSIGKYTDVAKKINFKKFPNVEIAGHQRAVRAILKKIARDKSKYIIVCTGGQGEPNAILSRIARKEYTFTIDPGDKIMFSCITIPTPVNIQNRKRLEDVLTTQGARIFRDVHVSGHSAREDHREFLHMVKPEHIIPCHGDIEKLAAFGTLAEEINKELGQDKYIIGKNVHLLRNGRRISI